MNNQRGTLNRNFKIFDLEKYLTFSKVYKSMKKSQNIFKIKSENLKNDYINV